MEIRIFKTKNFARWVKKEGITNKQLIQTIDEAEDGLIDADLGGGLIKKRIARHGQGKRGGHRVLLAFKYQDRSIFVFGFSKKDRENLDSDEKDLYRKLSKMYIGVPMRSLEKMCTNNQLFEVKK